MSSTRDWNINPITPGTFANQGVGCDPANYRPGNRFLDQASNEQHIWSINSNNWLYFSRRNIQDENPVFNNLPILGELQPCDGELSNPCPSGTGARYDADLHSLRRMHKAAIDTLEAQITNMSDTLDRGNRDSLLNFISINEFDNSLLTPILVNHSPLSDTVLIALLHRDPTLGDSLLLEVMSRNMPCSDTVFASLVNLFVQEAYLQSTRDSLLALQHYNPYYITPSVLQRELAHEKTGWLEAIYGIEAAYMEDDEQGDIISFYKDTLGVGFERELFAAYMGADSLGFSRAMLDSFPINTADDSLFVAYHSLLLDLKEDTLNWKQMDSLQLLQIMSIAAIKSPVQDYALAVLELLGDTVMIRFPEENNGEGARYAFKEKEETKTDKKQKPTVSSFIIYPNPNLGIFTIQLPKINGDFKVEITDLTGRSLFQENYTDRKENIVLTVNLSHLVKGVYLCSVNNEDIFIGTQRVVLIK